METLSFDSAFDNFIISIICDLKNCPEFGIKSENQKGGDLQCIERARNISAKANFSAILNYRQVSCDCPFGGINPSTARF